MSEGNEEPKIIVDEDWKTQVEREKAEAAAKQQAEASEAEAATSEASGGAGEPAATGEPAAAAASTPQPTGGDAAKEAVGDAARGDLPEASISSMVTLFFTQAMMMLGQFPDPSGGKPQIDKAVAKHYIDTLEVLQEKTQGNLTSDEEKMLNEALHAVRMAFLAS